jgi:beta-N-acetylhexosaminidase
MQKLKILSLLIFSTFFCISLFADIAPANDTINKAALTILHHMSLKEKIGQKLMLDFRYWCAIKPENNQACTQDFISMNASVKNIMSTNHLGGVILFANNLKDIPQITTLNYAFQQTMLNTDNLPLLIGTDQEGGIVARLPRDLSVTFPGNMAIAAAYLGKPEESYSTKIGNMIATDLKAVGINTDFAPDVDVNVNPLNPVIHVRSFSDDPQLVSELGLKLSQAIQEYQVAATLKHFPGHGDTITDSHIGLPVVNHTIAQAWKIDLYPFKYIIAQSSPDLIMTAHIQYPALDNSQIYAEKADKTITVPATLSRTIQYDLLRKQLGFQGVIITDALDMGAIAQNFNPDDATIKAFQAGVDIALMPVAVTGRDDAAKVSALIKKIETAVLDGTISEKELDKSVLRIIRLKISLGLFKPDQLPLAEKISHAEHLFSDKNQQELENAVTNNAVTLVQNNNKLLPLQLQPNTRIHILTPWLEQGAGIAVEIARLQAEQQLPKDVQINYSKMADTDLATEKIAIDNADIIIVGNSTTKSLPIIHLEKLIAMIQFPEPADTLVFPERPNGDSVNTQSHRSLSFSKNNELNEAELAWQALLYAKNKGKKTIFISLLCPYDLPNYQNVADVMLAGYDYYGYLTEGNRGYYRGPSMPALTRIIFGINNATGKLPINIPNPVKPDEIIYPRGFGLTTGF